MDNIKIKYVCPVREGLQCKTIKTDPETKELYIEQCLWYRQLDGCDPQTGDITKDNWQCEISWNTLLLIENSAQQRSTAVAVESFRNEMVNSNTNLQQVLLKTSDPLLLKN